MYHKLFKPLSVNLATLGPIGYLPARGTIATLFTLFIVYFLKNFDYLESLLFLIFCSFLIFNIVKNSLKYFKKSDPLEIVADEVLGCLITFYTIPFSKINLIIGFLLFRFFDIFKPFGIKKLEKISGPWGILLDDIVAGLISNIFLRFFIYE